MMFAAALHAGVLLASAWAMPGLGETEATVVPSTATPYDLYRSVLAPPEEDDLPAVTLAASNPDGRERADSRCGEVRGGSMGDLVAAKVEHRYGVQGPQDNPDPHIARAVAVASSSYDNPMIGLFPARWGGDPDAPVMAWGRDDSLGNDARSALGNMWGEGVEAAFGSPGAGIGLKRICPTCGDYGRGIALHLGTAGGGATGTERAGGLGDRAWAPEG